MLYTLVLNQYLASIYRGHNIHYVTIDPRHAGKGKPLNPNPSQKAVRGKNNSESEVEMARTKWLKIRVSDQEIADIKKRTGAHDMSNYVRKLVLDQPIAPPEPKHKKIVHSADPELVRAINRIGININQIAKQTNTGQEVGNAVLIALLDLQTTLDKALASSMPDDR